MTVFSLYFLAALIALSVQSVFFKGVKPDLVLILVFFYALKYGQMKGVLFGALMGLLVDFSSGVILGPHMMSKIFIGYFAASIRQKMFQWNIVLHTIMIIVFSIFDVLFIIVCLGTFADIAVTNRSMKVLIIQVLFTVVVSIIVYHFMLPEKDELLSRKEQSWG
jgi:rod shape-determining protein MreD